MSPLTAVAKEKAPPGAPDTSSGGAAEFVNIGVDAGRVARDNEERAFRPPRARLELQRFCDRVPTAKLPDEDFVP